MQTKKDQPVSPTNGISFRDKVTSVWENSERDSEIFCSYESDVEEEEDDPRCPTIQIPNDEKIHVRREFANVIIISTLGKKFSFAFMSRKIPQIWAKKGEVNVSDVGWGFFVVKFQSTEDYERAMFGGPWMVVDHCVVIQNWGPYFRPKESSPSTLRVWIKLRGIPLEYIDQGIVTRIGD
ncbi:hypothetical protein LINPERHAP2_LOCUS22628 [Linum perenne]